MTAFAEIQSEVLKQSTILPKALYELWARSWLEALDRGTAFQQQAMDFTMKRLSHDLDTAAALSRSRGGEAALKIVAEFQMDALRDYSAWAAEAPAFSDAALTSLEIGARDNLARIRDLAKSLAAEPSEAAKPARPTSARPRPSRSRAKSAG